LPASDAGASSTQAPLISEDGTLQVPGTAAVDEAAPERTQVQDLDNARDAVAQAINGSSTTPLEPIQALNAQSVDLPMGSNAQQSDSVIPVIEPQLDTSAITPAPQSPQPIQAQQPQDSSAPPAVPPPMMPPSSPY
jgi:hypothetical protein